MIYELTFLKSAKKEWDKLSPPIKQQFKAKLVKRIEKPRVPKDKLAGMDECYKIKLGLFRNSVLPLLWCHPELVSGSLLDAETSSV